MLLIEIGDCILRPKIGLNLMATINTEQKVQYTISPTTDEGNPARIDGIPQWESSDTNIVTVAPAGDGMSCMAISGTVEGSATVTVTADADLGQGVRNITESQEVRVTLAEASKLGLKPGEPQPK
jgi:hypothetical protein